MTDPAGHGPLYRLGPRSTRGLVAGWRSGQLICLALGALLALGLLRSLGGAAGALLAVLLAGGAVALATWPIGGRTVEEWAPTVARFAMAAGAAKTGSFLADGNLRPWGAGRPRSGPLSRLRLETLDGVACGAIVDQQAGTWAGVMAVGGAGFALVDEAQRAERIAAWSSVLAAVAHDGGGLYRLQWVARTLPAYLIGAPPELPRLPTKLLGDARPECPGEPPGFAAAARGEVTRSYAELLEGVGAELWAREVLVAVTVREARLRTRRRGSGGPDPVLARQMELVADRIRSVGLSCSAPFSVGQIAHCLRRSIDLVPVDEPVTWPWPVGVEDRWSRLRTDASWHVTYWVAEWPRSDVGAGWLLPLIVAGGLRHTVAMTMAPLSTMAAVRRAERERTSGTADAELRRRHGFALTARARREQEARHQREAELAEGHGGFRFSGYVTVTGADPSELEDACIRVEQAAAISNVEVRRLFGAQEAAFCCSLPLGRGCAGR